MKKISMLLILICTSSLFSQVKIGNNPSQINSNSLLELESSNKVFVLTRVDTNEMNGIAPLPGALVYNTDVNCIFSFNGETWLNLCNSGTDSQSLSFNNQTNILTLENGGSVDLSSYINTDDQALTFNTTTNVLTLEDGGTVDLSKFLDDTDTDDQTITNFAIDGSNVLTISLEDGNTQTVDLSSLNNSGTDDQALTFNNTTNVLTLEDGGTVDLSKFLDDTDTDDQTITNFAIDGSNMLTITLEDGNTQTVDLSSLNNSGTDDQAITFNATTNVLTLEDGGTVDLSKFLDDTDTDNQTITNFAIDGSNVLTITLEDGNTQTVDLSSLNNSGTDDQALTFNATSNVLTLEDGGTVDLSKFLDDTDTDNQTITNFAIDGSNMLTITLEDGNTQTVDLSSLNNSGTDDQALTFNATTNVLTLEDGGTVDLSKFLDDTDTDDQTITNFAIDGSNVLTITLEDGNTQTVDLSGYVNNDTNELLTGATLSGTDLNITDAGGTTTVDLSSLNNSGTDDQALTFNNTTNVLTLEDGGTVDLSKFLDDTDTDNQTITNFAIDGSNVLTITLEDGNTQTVDLSSLNNSGTDDQALTFNTTTNVLTLEDGGTVDLSKFLDDTDTDDQTITNFAIDGSNMLTITLEDGNTQTVDLSSLNNSGTDDQALTFNTTSNVLTLEDGGTVDLSKFLDDTDTDDQTITNFAIDGSNVLTITLEDGNTQTVDLSSLNNSGTDDQALTFNTATNVLTLEDGGTVDLSKFLDDTDTDDQTITNFAIDGSNMLTITLEDGNTQTVDLSSLNNSGTDDQALTFNTTSNVLTLEDGGTVDLSKFLDDTDTDDQTITNFAIDDSNVLTITLEDGNTQTVDLSSYVNNDINELITGATLTGTDLNITDAGGTTIVDLSSLNNSGTDDQALTFNNTTNVLTLEDGGTVDLSKFLDDTDTDDQTITNFAIDGSNVLTITLEDGNTQTVDLSGYVNNDTNELLTGATLSGTDLNITDAGGTTTVDLSSLNNSGTDDQALTFNNTTNVLTLEDGGTVDLSKFLDDTDTDNQTITNFAIDGSNLLTITLEDGNTQTVDLSSLNNSGTDDQALTFNNITNVLTLEDGGTVDLSKFLDDTDTDDQTITYFAIDGSNVLTITLEDGNTQTVDLSGYVNNDTNELLTGATLSGTDLNITDAGGTTTVDLSSLNNSGTDDQALTFNNTTNVLTLEDGGTVDLSKFLDDTDTDDQTITNFAIDGSNVLTITLEDGNTQTVDLSGLVNDADNDTSNELQSMSRTGTNITLSNGGGTVSIADNDDDSSNEIQSISKTGTTISLSNGGGSISETVTNLSQNVGDGQISYINENGTAQTANVVGNDANNSISVGSNGGAYFQNPIKAFGKVEMTYVGTNSDYVSHSLVNGFNISSVSRINQGDYQVIFNTPMPNNDYIIQLTIRDCNGDCPGNNGSDYDDPGVTYYNQTTTGFYVNIGDSDNGTAQKADIDLEFMITIISLF